MNQAPIPGADVKERGHSTALGQASHSWGRKRRKRGGSRSAHTHPGGWLYRKADEGQVPEKPTVGVPAGMGAWSPGHLGLQLMESLGMGLTARVKVSLVPGLQLLCCCPVSPHASQLLLPSQTWHTSSLPLEAALSWALPEFLRVLPPKDVTMSP